MYKALVATLMAILMLAVSTPTAMAEDVITVMAEGVTFTRPVESATTTVFTRPVEPAPFTRPVPAEEPAFPPAPVYIPTDTDVVGFDSARLPLRVILQDGVSHDKATLAMEAWNEAAGVTLFVLASEYTRIDVIIGNGVGHHAWMSPHPNAGPYTRCDISVTPLALVSTYTHELGHCLGLADSVHLSQWEHLGIYPGMTVCDDPTHPNYSPYDGIMSYCGKRHINAGDIAALELLGYTTH